MNPYVVRQGDYLAKLAYLLGFDADTVWNDPKNADLKSLRSPNLLSPGDVLWVPDASPQPVPVTGGTTNPYAASIPVISVRLCFKSDKGPLANEPCVVEGLGDPKEMTTDGQGLLVVSVPVDAREIRVAFPNQNVVHPILIGDMDPIDETSGVRKRLMHLGHYGLSSGALTSLSEDDAAVWDRQAILSFQRAQGLEATGTLDDAAKAALVEAHGS